MKQDELKCMVCQESSGQIPLIALIYRGEQYYVCPQHLPVLIHRPQALVGILPGAEKFPAHSGDH
jgi:hypothetical protein